MHRVPFFPSFLSCRYLFQIHALWKRTMAGTGTVNLHVLLHWVYVRLFFTLAHTTFFVLGSHSTDIIRDEAVLSPSWSKPFPGCPLHLCYTYLYCNFGNCFPYFWFMGHYCSLHRWDLNETRFNCLNHSWLLICWIFLDIQFKNWRALSQNSTLEKIWVLRQLPKCRYPFTQLGPWYRETIYAWKLSNFPFASKGVSKDPSLQILFSPLWFFNPKKYSILRLEWTDIKKEDVANLPSFFRDFSLYFFLHLYIIKWKKTLSLPLFCNVNEVRRFLLSSALPPCLKDRLLIGLFLKWSSRYFENFPIFWVYICYMKSLFW